MAATQVRSYGNNVGTDRNIFSVLFDQDLSGLCKYKAWDNNALWPQTGALTSVSNAIFVKGNHASGSMICLIDTTGGAPVQDWKATIPADQAESNPNRLKGNTYYVEQDGSNVSAGGRITFNMVIEVDSSALTTDNMGFDLEVEYSYTGTAPAPVFQFSPVGNTEGAPGWTTITQDALGVKHCRLNSGPSGGDFYANIPASGQEDTVEAWVTDE